MHAFYFILAIIFSFFSVATAIPKAHVYGITLAERDTYISCALTCRSCRSCADYTDNADGTSSCEYSCDTACMVDPFRYKADTACPTKPEELKARWNVRRRA